MVGLIIELIGRKTLIGFGVGLLVGLLLGWIFLGWLVFPVKWTNAAPVDLHPGYRELYLDLVARAYAADRNLDVQRLLGERWSTAQLQETLQTMVNKAGPAEVKRLQDLAQALNLQVSPTGAVQPPPPKKGGVSPLLQICLLSLLFILVVGGGGYLFLLRRGRARPAGAQPSISATVQPTAWAGEAEKPMAQFVATYTLGDDYFDPSFSIETETGEFLGECGIGISEAIGVGDPKKVTAFEVWLFDKNDIRTVTKVLMSDHAYNDEGLRTKLAPKGEPVLAQPGQTIDLETATLRVRARVLEMQYGTGNLPPNSFFERLVVELAAWQKEGEAAA
ncbi:MAG TPA: hypothetical protein ENK56_06575 [Chloroflexi bacterium]|nr:hypothetical protein [Chloroflexota bacterium]